MHKKYIFFLLIFSFGIKIIFLLFSYATTSSKLGIYDQYLSLAKKNDSYWYEKISNNGYPEIRKKKEIGFSEGKNYKQSEWAFFPFYPLLNKFTSKVLHTNFDASALIWSTVFSIAGILGIYWFGLIYFKNHSIAFFNSLIFFSFPFSFYYSTFYTEAIFISLVIYSFISIHYQKYLILALLLIPLTLLRPNGIIILLPLYLYHLEQKGFLKQFNLNWKNLICVENVQNSLYFLSAPITFFMFCLYQYKMTGFYFAFSIAQDGWYREFMFPLLSFFRRGDFATQFNSIFTIGVIVYAIWTRKKLPISLNIFIFLSILLPLCSGSVISMPRFVSVIFPLFMTFSYIIHKMNFKYYFLVAIISLQLFSFYGWLINHTISY